MLDEAADSEGVLHQLVCCATVTHHRIGDLERVACVYRVLVRRSGMVAKAVSNMAHSSEFKPVAPKLNSPSHLLRGMDSQR